MSCSTNNNLRVKFKALLIAAALSIAPVFCIAGGVLAQESFDRPDAPVRILGGDWVWEFERGAVRGTGTGGLTITWGDGIRATAQTARVARPPVSFELAGGVRVDFEARTLYCDSLSYSEDADMIVASGGVRVESAEPAITIDASIASFIGAGKGEKRLVAFAGGVVMTGEGGARLECEEMIYTPGEEALHIEGAFEGRLPLEFIDDAENPFFGRTAAISGIDFIALLDSDGAPIAGAAENVTIETGNAELRAPDLEFTHAEGGRIIALHGRGGEMVTGWFRTERGERGDFECSHLTMEETTGRMTLSGDVWVGGEGVEMLSGLVNLDYIEGFYKVTSERRATISFDDLRLIPIED